MKIIYFTTAQEKEDYVSFSSAWNATLNTAIQNLHNRLIRALGMTHEVDVISIRPFSRRFCSYKKLTADSKQEGKITWHYLEVKRLKLPRYVSIRKQCQKIVSKINLKDAIILTDTLNPNVLNNACLIAEKFSLPIIGVCNNTPSGIHDTGKSYTSSILSQATDLSGFISLTPGLNELFNKYNRANMTFEGIIDDKYQPIDVSMFGQYIFYDGSLEEKYGVYDLIRAFKDLRNNNYKLLLSGYHKNENKLNKAIKDSDNILYLGNLQNNEVLSLANNALVNVNPLPYTEDYDRYMIPDNIVDYFAANAITLSVRNRHFKKYFENDAIWVNSSETSDLLSGLKIALNLSKEEREAMIKKANADANKLYSMTMINHRTILFLKQFLKQKE